MDLPHTNEGYIQEEETAFRRAIDENLYRKLGSDINYLKDQSDATNIFANTVFASTFQAKIATFPITTDGSGNFGGVVNSSTNGKPLLFALGTCVIGTAATPFPLICTGPSVELAFWTSSGTIRSTGTYPLMVLTFVGPSNNQLYLAIGTGSPALWSPGATGIFYMTLIYPT